MIHSLKIKNFLSFRDEVCLNFEATNDKHLEDYLVVKVAPNVRLTKLGIVYGANASGKSNLLMAFEFLKNFWFQTPISKDAEIKVTPFLLDEDSRNHPSEFELIFYIEDHKYIYNLAVNQYEVVNESLKYYPSIQPFSIFSRESKANISEIVFNSKYNISRNAHEQINLFCLKNMSLFAAYNKVNIQIPELEIANGWFREHIKNMVRPDSGLSGYVKSLIKKDKNVKPFLLDFLHEADYNISDINVQYKEEPIKDELISDLVNDERIPEKEKARLKKDGTIRISRTTFMHRVIDQNGSESIFELPDSLQSDGTLRTMGLAGILNTVTSNNDFVAVDEIEASLHPRLVEFIIEKFIKESRFAQLLLTTHYDGLLEADDLIRNDNIWFTNKTKDGATELYSLSDFNGLSRISSLQKAYKFGKFGAIPNI